MLNIESVFKISDNERIVNFFQPNIPGLTLFKGWKSSDGGKWKRNNRRIFFLHNTSLSLFLPFFY